MGWPFPSNPATPPKSVSPPGNGSPPPTGPPSGAPAGGCPAVWTTISKDLTAMFLSGGQCNDDARASIRAIFHDCFPDGGCDGSIALPDELNRQENSIMAPTINKLSALAKQRNVTVADMIVYASSHAVATCPGGPTTPTFIGRKDATSAAPPNELPQPNVSAEESIGAFQKKGFSVSDLVALIGAHTASKQFTVDPAKAGEAQDTTPGTWDVTYYSQTVAGKAPFTFQADTNLVNAAQAGPVFKQFASNKPGWDANFASALSRMQLLGGNKASMVDCTSTLPRAHFRRNAMAAPMIAGSYRAYH
ncbi:heme peroxidase [Microthyrium microscopicum]|uniref:Peroxidase n=1 Tax=Microthyrium microscopicum TaxID=703497 RepID=A0A6A6TTR1_9PEZI|nr:heme peroxidase [Microthyrium microscopicum]